MKKRICVYTITFAVIIAVFFVLMVIVHYIPPSLLADNVSLSLSQIAQEGKYPQLFFYNNASQLDNFTDKLMIEMNTEAAGHGMSLAMSNNDYARYWHGYQVFLRPLLMFFSYAEIRFISVIVFFSLLVITAIRLYKKLGLKTVIAFLISIISANIVLIPVSLQFVSVFNISFILIIALSFNRVSKSSYVPLCFMCIGMLTNFIDLLTAPLIALGLPLIVYLILRYKDSNKSWKDNFKSLIQVSIAWFLGYGLCCVSKWALSSIFTGKNVFAEAIGQIFFRAMGNESEPVSRWETIWHNFITLFGENKFLLCFFLLLGVILIVLSCIYRVDRKCYARSSFFIIIALLPYIWYFVLSNHSQIHFWFTFRTQTISVFAILIAILSIINWNKFKNDLRKIKDKAIKLYGRIFQKK